MNFTQMHERLRLELLRRIQRGSLSVSLLARQTGYGQSHLSNFLRSKRQLSLEAMDRILAAQHMATSDLLPGSALSAPAVGGTLVSVPIVSNSVAMDEQLVRPSAIQAVFQAPAIHLQGLDARPSPERRAWQRFVAIHVPEAEAAPMMPVLQPGAVVLLDRHSIALDRRRANRLNLFAVRCNGQLKLRHVDYRLQRLVLLPHDRSFDIDLVAIRAGESLADIVVGRVVLIMNEM